MDIHMTVPSESISFTSPSSVTVSATTSTWWFGSVKAEFRRASDNTGVQTWDMSSIDLINWTVTNSLSLTKNVYKVTVYYVSGGNNYAPENQLVYVNYALPIFKPRLIT